MFLLLSQKLNMNLHLKFYFMAIKMLKHLVYCNINSITSIYLKIHSHLYCIKSATRKSLFSNFINLFRILPGTNVYIIYIEDKIIIFATAL